MPSTLPLGNVSSFPLGLSGDPGTGTDGILISYPLSHFCHPKKQPTSNNPGISNGDPYLSTFDHAGYGFQTAGEFTLVKSTVDDLEIQSRQVPYRLVLGPQWGNSLAMNTAFAMRDGGAIVEVDKGSPLVLYINRHRRRARPGQVIALSGGGSVRYSHTKVVVTWADGTQATVLSIGAEGVNISVNPSVARAGRLRGLFGNDDGKRADDFVGRDGKHYSAKMIERVGLFVFTRAQVRTLLGGFGRSWRITQAHSLFVYPRGKNTRSYLVARIPTGADVAADTHAGAPSRRRPRLCGSQRCPAGRLRDRLRRHRGSSAGHRDAGDAAVRGSPTGHGQPHRTLVGRVQRCVSRHLHAALDPVRISPDRHDQALQPPFDAQHPGHRERENDPSSERSAASPTRVWSPATRCPGATACRSAAAVRGARPRSPDRLLRKPA